VIARLRVDPIACEGHAVCTEMLPELITLDDWGFPIIGDGPVPRRLLGDVRVTVRACPKLALRISDEGSAHIVRRVMIRGAQLPGTGSGRGNPREQILEEVLGDVIQD